MKLVLAASMVALVGGQALAADLPTPTPLAGVKYFPTAAYNWGGGYFGLNGGYGFGQSEWTLAGVSTGSFNVNGFLFGGTLGANFQIGRLVLGLEGDFDWSGIAGSSSVAGCAALGAPVGAACQTKSADWLSTGRGRVAAARSDQDLPVFASPGGLALTNVEAALTQPAVTDSDVVGGWTVGAGIEFALADNWTAKAEYLFVDFGNITCTVSLPVCGTGTVSLTAENIVRAGINYKFYWSTPSSGLSAGVFDPASSGSLSACRGRAAAVALAWAGRNGNVIAIPNPALQHTLRRTPWPFP